MPNLANYSSAAFSTASGVAVAASSTVEVRRESDGGLASLFSDEAGASGIANPFTADATGRFSFYVVGVSRGYSVLVTKGAENYTVHNQAIGTVAQLDQAAVILASLFTALGDTGVATASATLARASAAPAPINLTMTSAVAGSALTIAIKGRDGNDPSATNPVLIPYRNATADLGDYSWLALTAATSLVISSGSTLGASNGVAFRGWIVSFNDAGTQRLGVINCRSGTNIYPLSGFGIASSTAEGGAGAADSAHVFYTGTAVTSKAYTVLGYFSYEGTGLATAGTYASRPTRLQPLTRDVPLPGVVLQEQDSFTGAVNTGTTIIPADDTIPQITEGTEFMSKAITPTSAANVLDIESQSQLSVTAGNNYIAALFQDATANALVAIRGGAGGADTVNVQIPLLLRHRMVAATGSATTMRVRAGGTAASTITFNGTSSARLLGGVSNSYLRVREIMA